MSSLAADPYAMDSIEAKNKLTEAGVAPAQAEAIVRVAEAQSRTAAQTTAREEITKNAASKTEFGALREDFKALADKVDKLGDKVNTLDKKVDVGFASFEAKFNMLIWIIGIGTPVIIAMLIALATIILSG